MITNRAPDGANKVIHNNNTHTFWRIILWEDDWHAFSPSSSPAVQDDQVEFIPATPTFCFQIPMDSFLKLGKYTSSYWHLAWIWSFRHSVLGVSKHPIHSPSVGEGWAQVWLMLSKQRWFRRVGKVKDDIQPLIDNMTTTFPRWSYVCGPGTPPLIGQTIGQVTKCLSLFLWSRGIRVILVMHQIWSGKKMETAFRVFLVCFWCCFIITKMGKARGELKLCSNLFVWQDLRYFCPGDILAISGKLHAKACISFARPWKSHYNSQIKHIKEWCNAFFSP